MYGPFTLLCVAAIFGETISEAFPEHPPCKLEDSKCLTEYTRIAYSQFVVGNEALGIPASDPLFIDNIDGNLAGIEYLLTNCTLVGLKDCDFKSVEASKDHKQLTFKMFYAKNHITGHYKLNGTLINTPIHGDGGFMLELYNYSINIVVDVEKVPGKDGATTIAFKKFKIDADLKGGMNFEVENLLDDNNELAESLLKGVRENPKPVINMLQEPALNKGYKILFKKVNKYLKNISVDKLIQE